MFVVVTHSYITGFRPNVTVGPVHTDFGVDTLVYAGSLGVELFFYLSGFVLFLPYARAACGERALPTLWHFIDRRVIKIVPSYYLALAFVAVLFYLPRETEADRTLELFRHVTFAHPFWHASMFAFVAAFWSLGVEVQFYVLFPAIAALMRRWPVPTYLGLLGIGESYRVYLHVTQRHTDFFDVCQLPAQIDLFGLGMLCAYGYVRFRKRLVGRFVAPIATALACTAVGVGTWLLNDFAYVTKTLAVADHQTWQNDHRLVVGFVVATLAMSSLFAVRSWRALVANPLLVWLSTISYNVYLWHEAIMVQCSQTGFPCSGIPKPWLTDTAWGDHYFAAYVGLSILIATVVTYGFERPLLRLGTGGAVRALIARMPFAKRGDAPAS